mgnify:CR=1 FL=1
MGRREFFEEQKLKRLVYVFSITLVVSIAIFLTIFVMYNKKLKEESSQSLMSLEKMNDIVDNSELEEASYSSDSTVKNSNNTSNTVSSNNTNKETSDKTKNNISKTPIGSTVQNTTKENTSNANNVSNTENTENTSNNISNNTIIDNTVKEELAFKAPVSGEIIKDFAMDTLVYSNTLEEWTTHSGIDIKADKTSIVVAAEAGTVESIKNDPRYGLTVTISHVNGFKTVYSNLLTTEFISENETVEKGQTIGTVGETASFEIADEPHLHFEMYKDNQLVNPTIYLK